jgi:chorismate mutase
MQLNRRSLAILVAFAIGPIHTARAQSSEILKLQPLVETTARRLALAEQVALAKWDSHTRVDDPPREAQVIMSAMKQGDSMGLDGRFVSDFFRAQIEANKLIQYHLLAGWYRAGKAPAHTPINLAKTVRVELDRVQTALITALADTVQIRANAACRADIAMAVGKYVSSHDHDPR